MLVYSFDGINAFQNAYPAVSHTIFANRIVSDVYLADGDYEKTMKAAKQGLACLDSFQVDTGIYLQRWGSFMLNVAYRF